MSQTRALLRVQPFKHQGKERIEFAGNYLHDHGARMAHNAIGRWSVMDPLMEKYYPVSPYVYCGNNPVSFVDKDGRRILFFSGVSAIKFPAQTTQTYIRQVQLRKKCCSI